MKERKSFHHFKTWRGQSFVELAITLPVLILIMLGLVEVAFFMGKYMDILDMTREAARFASQRDPSTSTLDEDCSTAAFNFFYDTACVLSPPSGSADCPTADFCNGFNRYAPPDPARDDIIVSVFTVSGNTVSHSTTWNWATPENYSKDCQGDPNGGSPYYDSVVVDIYLNKVTQIPGASPNNKGFVAVEYFYCYHQVLVGLGTFIGVIPDPVRIHAYSLFPLPAAQPTPTPPTP